MSLDDIQAEISALVDQDADTSVLSNDDYTLRTNYINRALREWSEVGQWQVLYKQFNSYISTSTGNASVALPSDFRKLAAYPHICNADTANEEFPDVLPQEDQLGNNSHRVWIMGSSTNGYIMRVHGTTLASGASLMVPYYKTASSLVSPADVADIPNPEYLVQKTVGYIWEGREDPRFPQAKAEADRILSNMMERENTPNFASGWGEVHTVDARTGFKWGTDG